MAVRIGLVLALAFAARAFESIDSPSGDIAGCAKSSDKFAELERKISDAREDGNLKAQVAELDKEFKALDSDGRSCQILHQQEYVKKRNLFNKEFGLPEIGPDYDSPSAPAGPIRHRWHKRRWSPYAFRYRARGRQQQPPMFYW